MAPRRRVERYNAADRARALEVAREEAIEATGLAAEWLAPEIVAAQPDMAAARLERALKSVNAFAKLQGTMPGFEQMVSPDLEAVLRSVDNLLETILSAQVSEAISDQHRRELAAAAAELSMPYRARRRGVSDRDLSNTVFVAKVKRALLASGVPINSGQVRAVAKALARAVGHWLPDDLRKLEQAAGKLQLSE